MSSSEQKVLIINGNCSIIDKVFSGGAEMAGYTKRPKTQIPLHIKLLFGAAGVVAAALVAALILLVDLDAKPIPASPVPETHSVSDAADTSSSTTTTPQEPVRLSEYITVVPETTPDTTATKRTTSETVQTTTSGTTTTPAPETTETTSSAPETTETDAVTESAAKTTAPPPSNDTYDKSYFANDLFIGDSIYTGLYLYDYFPNNQVFAKVGLNPQSARITRINGYTAVRRATEGKPAHIFIMLGTNGLAYMSPSFMADELKALVGELKEASPDSSIYIVSIPPVTKVHEQAGQETMEMVNKYNGLLKDMCGECSAEYLDLCSQLQDENGYFSSLYAEADGMHFLGAAYKKMLAYFYKETQ